MFAELALLLVAATSSAEPSDDSRACSALLVGDWNETEASLAGAGGTWTTRFRADGTFTEKGELQFPNQAARKYDISGTWQLLKGTLTYVVNQSADPSLIPIGMVSIDHVKEINAASMTYQDRAGRLLKMTRAMPRQIERPCAF